MIYGDRLMSPRVACAALNMHQRTRLRVGMLCGKCTADVRTEVHNVRALAPQFSVLNAESSKMLDRKFAPLGIAIFRNDENAALDRSCAPWIAAFVGDGTAATGCCCTCVLCLLLPIFSAAWSQHALVCISAERAGGELRSNKTTSSTPHYRKLK